VELDISGEVSVSCEGYNRTNPNCFRRASVKNNGEAAQLFEALNNAGALPSNPL